MAGESKTPQPPSAASSGFLGGGVSQDLEPTAGGALPAEAQRSLAPGLAQPTGPRGVWYCVQGP